MADELLDRIGGLISRREMFRPGDRVGVAVSGGADSVFLFHALRELAPRWNLELSVVHIEHGIRGAASVADAEFVASWPPSSDFPFISAGQRLAAGTIWSRRRGAFARVLRGALHQRQVDRIATGHTRSDQAETVLYPCTARLRTGWTGGYPAGDTRRPGAPAAGTDRAEIEAWLRERPSTGAKTKPIRIRLYARNRLRHEILPLLRGIFNPRLDEALANLATLAQDEELYWESELARHLPPSLQEPPVFLSATSKISAAPRALSRRLIRRAIAQAKGDLRQIDFAHVERILEMARSRRTGTTASRCPAWTYSAPSNGFVWPRSPETRPSATFRSPSTPPDPWNCPASPARITLQVLEKPEIAQPYVTVVDELDWQRLHALDGGAPSLELRNWRPGDQYRPAGQSKQEKIKFMFQEARVPLWERRNWPIITYNGIILWTRRFGAAAEYAADPSARMVLRVRIRLGKCRTSARAGLTSNRRSAASREPV